MRCISIQGTARYESIIAKRGRKLALIARFLKCVGFFSLIGNNSSLEHALQGNCVNVLIAYHSDYSNTKKMADAIAAGMKVSCSTANITLRTALETAMDDLVSADVIVFGTPVHMGSMAWQLKQLVDRAGKLWMEGALEGKVGAVFATGGGFGGGGGGVETTMVSLHSNFLEHGMMVVGFPKSLPGYADGGLQWGAYGRSGDHQGMPATVSEAALAAARSYGAHVAEMAVKLID